MRGMEIGRRAKVASFRIEQVDSRCRESSGNYEYRIYADDRPIARFWHDWRGDDHGFEFLSRSVKSDWPFGTAFEFIDGGGPEPLTLSEPAIAYLASHFSTPDPGRDTGG
ncbi:hypothetical protein I41_36870 [Lacipirellula limnantheis]|uniref:Uncharacterized protein n=1 Tax=Lacipirellula limnantheis TaxID=2528024 RepID=A0A517U1K2_9BACT|nr:hypothetical protein I41_36870 [Lacipirellula limnantheis]